MPRHFLFYVTGHGYGHARRTAQVIAALRRLAPDARVSVRSTAPASIFARVGVAAEDLAAVAIDPGVVEDGPLRIDGPRSAAAAMGLSDRAGEMLDAELRSVRGAGVSLVVTDMPPLAGHVAAGLGVPCWASGNFTWDWIYEPYLLDVPRRAGERALGMMAEGYGRMTGVLRHPFHHAMPQFRRVVDVPLVAAHPSLGREATGALLGLDRADPRPRVLVGMRGGTVAETLARAARDAPEFLFLTAQPGPALPNVRVIAPPAAVDFADLLAAVDVVVSKFGYGTVADGVAAGVRMLAPVRESFREEELFATAAGAALPVRRISRAAYEAGAWAAPLRELMAQPVIASPPPTDGAEVCARHLLACVP